MKFKCKKIKGPKKGYDHMNNPNKYIQQIWRMNMPLQWSILFMYTTVNTYMYVIYVDDDEDGHSAMLIW